MLTLVDVIIVVSIISLFYLMSLTGIVPIAVCIGAGVVLHFTAGGIIRIIEKRGKEIKLIEKQENRIQFIVQEFSSISIGSSLIENFVDSLKDFVRKKKVLLEISNDAFVRNEVFSAEDYLVRLSERLERKLKILEALDRYDDAYDAIISDIKEIVSTTDEFVTEFGNLLVEVGRSNDDDDDDERRQQLSKSTDRLRDIREQSKKLLEEDPDDGLFVVSSGSQIRI
ncbi:MAG: hypothetical protein IKG14_00465 [Clostridia bacterium]|nr:hypothetical protein [Clostridia bacterium]